MKKIKARLVNWLLKDVTLDELAVRRLIIGNKTVKINPDSIQLAPLTADPSTLLQGLVWYRSDLDEFRYSPDGSEVKKATVTPPVKRSDLEYPTENVLLLWLYLIEKADTAGVYVYNKYNVVGGHNRHLITLDTFTDHGVECLGVVLNVDTGVDVCVARYDLNTSTNKPRNYLNTLQTGGHSLYKYDSGSATQIGNESVSLSVLDPFYLLLSCVGSTIKSFRDSRPIQSSDTPKISATDTSFASGCYGVGNLDRTYVWNTGINLYPFCHWWYTRLKSAYSPLQKSLVVVEVDYEIIEHPLEKYPIIQPKLPKRIVGNKDLLSLTWGSIDFRTVNGKPISPTYLISITGNNPYNPNAINEVLSQLRARGFKVYTNPQNRIDEIYRNEKSDRDWLISKEELAYQILGTEKHEIMAVAKFYEREVINLGRVKPEEIPNFDTLMRRYISLAKKYKIEDKYALIFTKALKI